MSQTFHVKQNDPQNNSRTDDLHLNFLVTASRPVSTTLAIITSSQLSYQTYANSNYKESSDPNLYIIKPTVV